METVTVSREEYNQMKCELQTLRHSELYERLLAFEKNIQTQKFTRKDLGF